MISSKFSRIASVFHHFLYALLLSVRDVRKIENEPTKENEREWNISFDFTETTKFFKGQRTRAEKKDFFFAATKGKRHSHQRHRILLSHHSPSSFVSSSSRPLLHLCIFLFCLVSLQRFAEETRLLNFSRCCSVFSTLPLYVFLFRWAPSDSNAA